MLIVKGWVILLGAGSVEVEFDVDQDLVDQVFAYAEMMEDQVVRYDHVPPPDQMEVMDILDQWSQQDGYDPQAVKVEIKKEGTGKAQKTFVCLFGVDAPIPLRAFEKGEEGAAETTVARLRRVLNQIIVPEDERIRYAPKTGVLRIGYLASFHRDIWAKIDFGDPSDAAAKALEWAKTFGCEYSYSVGGCYEIDHAIAVAEREGAWRDD